MTRADLARRGDITRNGRTVEDVSATDGGNKIILYTRDRDDNLHEEVWNPSDHIDRA